MSSIKPRVLKGMRDFLPAEMRRRKYVLGVIERVFLSYGFEPCETPTIEYADILEGKYGEEEKLMYRFEDQGGRAVALKYDLTVPLARVVAQYQNELAMPFKRYQIQPVQRAEKPQKGRYREFYQCDVDIVGTTAMTADAELVQIAADALTQLGFNEFVIRINHRQLLRRIAEYAGVSDERADGVAVAIDKLDKIGRDGVLDELRQRGVNPESAEKILELIAYADAPANMIAELRTRLAGTNDGLLALDDLEKLFSILADSHLPPSNYQFDLTLARGLGYYTGPIFEIHVTEPKIGSLGGGGRYDRLIGMFLKNDIPACGISLGLERLIDVMTELDMFPAGINPTQVLISLFDENSIGYAQKVARVLRTAGINADLYYTPGKLKKQFGYADKKNIPYVIVAGPDEQAREVVTLKNMRNAEQTTLNLTELVEYFRP